MKISAGINEICIQIAGSDDVEPEMRSIRQCLQPGYSTRASVQPNSTLVGIDPQIESQAHLRFRRSSCSKLGLSHSASEPLKLNACPPHRMRNDTPALQRAIVGFLKVVRVVLTGPPTDHAGWWCNAGQRGIRCPDTRRSGSCALCLHSSRNNVRRDQGDDK